MARRAGLIDVEVELETCVASHVAFHAVFLGSLPDLCCLAHGGFFHLSTGLPPASPQMTGKTRNAKPEMRISPFPPAFHILF